MICILAVVLFSPNAVFASRIHVGDALGALYVQLLVIKEIPEFREKGFGAGFPLGNKWNEELSSIRKNRALPRMLAVAAGELQQLGLQYVSSKGRENNQTGVIRTQFVDSLTADGLDSMTIVEQEEVPKVDLLGDKYKIFAVNEPRGAIRKVDVRLVVPLGLSPEDLSLIVTSVAKRTLKERNAEKIWVFAYDQNDRERQGFSAARCYLDSSGKMEVTFNDLYFSSR
jgi:hypothetical protein